MRRIDGRLEEAALLVASPRRVFWRITLPLAAPSIVAAALVIFVLAVSEFGVPGLLRVRVYTTEVFTAFAALYDSGRAAVLALPLLALCFAVAAVAVALLGDRFVGGRRGAETPAALRLGRSRLRHGGDRGRPRRGAGLAAGAARRARRWAAARSPPSSPGPARPSPTACGWRRSGRRSWSASRCGSATRGPGPVADSVELADVALVVLFAMPGTLIGVGLIGVWNRPGPLGALYGTDSMLVLAYLARLLPVAILALAASARTVPVSHEEAAAVGGAGWLRTMGRIVLPQMRLGLVAAWLIAFVLAFGELGVSILVAPPGDATLPIRIYTLIANTPSSSVAVLALLQAGVVLGPLAILAALLARRDSS